MATSTYGVFFSSSHDRFKFHICNLDRVPVLQQFEKLCKIDGTGDKTSATAQEAIRELTLLTGMKLPGVKTFIQKNGKFKKIKSPSKFIFTCLKQLKKFIPKNSPEEKSESKFIKKIYTKITLNSHTGQLAIYPRNNNPLPANQSSIQTAKKFTTVENCLKNIPRDFTPQECKFYVKKLYTEEETDHKEILDLFKKAWQKREFWNETEIFWPIEFVATQATNSTIAEQKKDLTTGAIKKEADSEGDDEDEWVVLAAEKGKK